MRFASLGPSKEVILPQICHQSELTIKEGLGKYRGGATQTDIIQRINLIMGLVVAASCTLNESECFSDFWSCPIMLSEQNSKNGKVL